MSMLMHIEQFVTKYNASFQHAAVIELFPLPKIKDPSLSL